MRTVKNPLKNVLKIAFGVRKQKKSPAAGHSAAEILSSDFSRIPREIEILENNIIPVRSAEIFWDPQVREAADKKFLTVIGRNDQLAAEVRKTIKICK